MEGSITAHFFLTLTIECIDTAFAFAPNKKECSNSTAFTEVLLKG